MGVFSFSFELSAICSYLSVLWELVACGFSVSGEIFEMLFEVCSEEKGGKG